MKVFLKNKRELNRGFLLVEIILASSVFVLLTTAFVGTFLYGEESTVLAGNRGRAVMLAEEGIEAVRNIRDGDFANLNDGTYGLVVSSGKWSLSGTQDITDIFTRSVSISTIDPSRKEVISNVNWQQNAQRTGTVSITSRLTNWQASAAVAATCNDYAVEQGYSSGICRANANQCRRNGETHLPEGDLFCLAGLSEDTCCVLP